MAARGHRRVGLVLARPGGRLLLAGWAVREGISAWHGDDCC